MSTTETPPRPRQLVLAAGVVIGGSAFLVAAVFDSLSKLQSVDTRTQLREAVSSSTGKGMGITLDEATEALRVTLSLTGACAAVALVLGIFVLQRHRAARVALSIVAVPLLVTAPLVGGFLGAFVAVAALMLWNGPAGDWYAGRPIRQPAAPRGGAPQDRSSFGSRSTPPVDLSSPPVPPAVTPPAGGAHDVPSTRETSTAPEATPGFGEAAPDPLAAPSPAPAEWPYGVSGRGQQGQVTVPAPPASAPPTPVRVACLLTWTFSGSVTLMYLAGVVALIFDRGAIVDRVVASPAWRQAGVNDDVLVPLLWVGVLLFLAWSLGAVVLAYFTWRRHDWARYLLAVSAGLALLVGAIAFPVGILHQLACAATIGTLFAPRSRAWFASSARPPGAPSGPRQGPPPPPSGGPW
jgi:hypothetical protein